MSAVEVLTEIKKLSCLQRKKVFRFVTDELRREEIRVDNEFAEKSIAGAGQKHSVE